jgi:DNA-binding LacI/PurR family transcriptional regulator
MPPERRATIADVAAASGVGVGTVSLVINGAANVRETTRVSVQKVIDRLGYRPSHLAASLSRGTARTMAIVVPHLTRPSVVMRLAGALAVLDEQGYDASRWSEAAPREPADRARCCAGSGSGRCGSNSRWRWCSARARRAFA